MNFSDLLNSLLHDTTAISLPLFRPELALCATIVLMLLVRVFRGGEKINAFYIALIGSCVALWFAAPWQNLPSLAGMPRQELFTGLLVYDSFTIYFRALLMVFAVLFILLTKLSGIPDHEDGPDFYSLVLGGLLGMCLMASANHLLTIFLAVEMASVPSYVLAGMLKGRKKSSEAALKYAVYGAGAAGVMLYGISLMAGVLGSCHLPTMADRLAEMIAAGNMTDRYMVLALGGLMLGVGLAFKLSAFPFHFWCPDVFEGASAEVNAFLSVASKAAALALLIRVVVGFGTVQPQTNMPVAMTTESTAAKIVPVGLELVPKTPGLADGSPRNENPTSAAGRTAALQPVRNFMALLIALVAAVTCTFGNLAAYGQTNLKRLMAYSTIAHAGYIMMPVAAAVALMGQFPAEAKSVLAVVPFYMALYLFMNLGVFAIVAFLRNARRSEEIADYAGLVRVSPGVVVCLGLLMFSLVGLPPLAGFSAKYVAFYGLVQGMEVPAFRAVMLALLVVGGLNTALSLFYYIRVIKTMVIDPEPDFRPAVGFPLVSLRGAYVVLMTVPVLVLGLFWDPLFSWLQAGAGNLF